MEYMRQNRIKQNKFHDRLSRKRAQEQFEKEKRKEEELRKMKENSIKQEQK